MGSSGPAPILPEAFGQPTNPETLTPNFGQISGVGSGQPAPGFGGFPAPNGFSEFFTPGMPTMVSSPYIPSQSPTGGGPVNPPPSSGGQQPQMVTAFGGGGAQVPSNLGPSQQGPLMNDPQPAPQPTPQYPAPSMASTSFMRAARGF